MNARFNVHKIGYTNQKPRYFVYDYENRNWGRIFDNKYKADILCDKLNKQYDKELSQAELEEVKDGIANILKEINS